METKLTLEKELEPIFLGKFPAISDSIKEQIVQYGPYVIIVLAALGIFGLVTAFGVIGTVLGSGAFAFSTINFFIGLAFTAIILGLYVMAFSPLKGRKKTGWNFLYYAALISLFSNIIQLNVLGALIGGVISFWILFQIREKYVM